MTVLDLPVRDRLEVGPALAYLAAHAVPGSERHDAGAARHSRLLVGVDDVHAVTVEIRPDRVRLETDASPGPEREAVIAGVRRWLDLDADIPAIGAALAGDRLIGPLISARPGLRVIGYPDGFEGAVMTVLGQQVSLAAARTFGGRLAAAFGDAGPGGLTAFPGPARLASAAPEEIREAARITGSRARTIRAIAEAFATGLRLGPGADRAAARKRLLEIPGVGPWTVEYLAVRALRDPDAFPGGDLVLRRELGGVSAREATELSAAWSPWRAYALFHIWTSGAF